MTLAAFPVYAIDDAGNALAAAKVEMRRYLGNALVTLYADAAGAVSLGSQATCDADGYVQVFLTPGRYNRKVFLGAITQEDVVEVALGTVITGLQPAGDWDSGTTFGLSDMVSHADGGLRYNFVSLQAGNLNNEPDAATPATTAFWQLIGETVIGVDGSDPGVLFTFTDETADSDQGAGKVWADNADLSAAATLFLSKTSRGGSSIAAYLASLDDSTATKKGDVVLTRPSDEAQATFAVTALTDATGYVKLTVSGHAGETAFTAADPLSFQFYPKGDIGSTGASGASALTIVRAAATGNVDISSELENGDTIDGVTLATGDTVLLPAQTAPAQNGVYTVPASGAASRHTDFNGYDDLPGAVFSVMEGTANADTLWRCTSDRGGTIDSTALAISLLVAASVAEMFTASPRKHVSSANVRAAMTPAALTSGASVAVSLAAARKFTLTFDESFELQLPTNCAIGDEYVIHFTEGSGSSVTPSFASGHVFSGGVAPPINNGAGERTRLHFEVTAVSGSTATEVLVSAAGALWA